MDRSTIAAIATPLGQGGIGIVKISGPAALTVAETLFRPIKDGATINRDRLKSHRVYHGWIIDPQTHHQVDEVLLFLMRAPQSYTREDIVEIQAHSGFAVLSQILSLVLNLGVRLAEPGEFTKRAFLNGRIDLSQAEGVIDTIESKSHQALRMAMAQINGSMRHHIENICQSLTDCLVQIETAIDFIEDADDHIINDRLPRQLQTSVTAPLKALIRQYGRAHLFRDGIKMAVVGKPNVGKSSLLNALIKKDRAIVTDIPGTTRDLIEETIMIKGLPVVVVDTAGLRDGGDLIENIGIQKTWACIAKADIILFVIDASMPTDENDHWIFNQINDKNYLIIKNKIDLLSGDGATQLPSIWENEPIVEVSALKQSGLETLETSIQRAVLEDNGDLGENPLVPNLRQKLAFERADQAATRLVDGLQQQLPLEMIAIDAREAIEALGEITGETVQDTVIDNIFQRFCIGK